MKKDLKKYKEYLDNAVSIFEAHPFFLKSLGYIDTIRGNANPFYLLIPTTKEEEPKKEELPNETIIEISRSIIATIDHNLLRVFDETLQDDRIFITDDKLIRSGNYAFNNKRAIIISKNGGYDDIVTLIHEFMHLCNYSNNDKYLMFTEFFSVYFEIYAINYLNQERNIPKEELNYKNRIINDNKFIANLRPFIYAFYLYYKYRSFDITKYQELFPGFTKENFDLIYNFNMTRYEAMEFDNPNRKVNVGETEMRGIMYSIGLILTFYSHQFKSKEDVLKLYKELNNQENESLGLEELLTKYGFDLNEKTIAESYKSMIMYFEKNKDLSKENNETKLIKRKYSNWQVKTCLFYNEIL